MALPDFPGGSIYNPSDPPNRSLTKIVYLLSNLSLSGGTVATPSISGTTPFGASSTATITCATSGATIHYTTNGSTPTSASAAYSTPVAISATTTVKAIAVKSGMTDSDIASKTYTQIAYGNIYYGASATSVLDEAAILALSDSRINQITPANTYAFVPGTAKYFYFAWPDALTTQPTAGTGFTLGGFAVDMYATAPFDTVEAGWSYDVVSVGGVNYRVYRTTYTQTVSSTITVAAS